MPTSQEDAQVIVNKSIALFAIDPQPALARHLAQILEWNPTLGLVSRKDPLGACERLLCESLELGALLDVGAVETAADLGSGAGFPGLVWAVMHPRLAMTLIERRQRRAAFLERTVRALGVSNVAVVAQDLRDVSRETTFDLITTMAVGDPAEIAPGVEPLLARGGRFASTSPRDAAVSDLPGTGLHLERRVDGKFGCYLIYRRGV
jgi:16S rRNA (guanine527-N7)-methyltransferase